MKTELPIGLDKMEDVGKLDRNSFRKQNLAKRRLKREGKMKN